MIIVTGFNVLYGKGDDSDAGRIFSYIKEMGESGIDVFPSSGLERRKEVPNNVEIVGYLKAVPGLDANTKRCDEIEICKHLIHTGGIDDEIVDDMAQVFDSNPSAKIKVDPQKIVKERELIGKRKILYLASIPENLRLDYHGIDDVKFRFDNDGSFVFYRESG